MRTPTSFRCLSLALFVALSAGCASRPDVKAQAYAALPNQRVLEYDFATVWKGIESSVRELKVTSRDPKEVEELDLRNGKLRERKLETDWVYSRSRDKYQEYTVNGTPRKIYLQSRNRYTVVAKSVIGGTEVRVRNEEEIERLKKDGSSAGYDSSSNPDPSRASDLLAKIDNEILSAAP